jgi:hypothetical protein
MVMASAWHSLSLLYEQPSISQPMMNGILFAMADLLSVRAFLLFFVIHKVLFSRVFDSLMILL